MIQEDALHAGGETSESEPVRPVESARTTFRRLRMAGFSSTEAGNLTAHLEGLPAMPKGWTLHEIEALLFVRSLVERGRIGS
jgi:hypothetical protein